MKKSDLHALVKAAAYNVHRRNSLKRTIKYACYSRALRKEDLKGAILSYMSGDKYGAGVGQWIGGRVGRLAGAAASHGFQGTARQLTRASNLLNTGLRNTGRTLWNRGAQAASGWWQRARQAAGNPRQTLEKAMGTEGKGLVQEGSGARGWFHSLTGRNQRDFMKWMPGENFSELAAAGKKNMAGVADQAALRTADQATLRGIERAGDMLPKGFQISGEKQVGAIQNQARRLQAATNRARLQAAGAAGVGLVGLGAVGQAGGSYDPDSDSIRRGYRPPMMRYGMA